jgi:hypothetical protein
MLWKIGKSTDVERGLECARNLRMITEADEAFIRRAFEIDAAFEAGTETDITQEMVDELRKCANRLNAADPA